MKNFLEVLEWIFNFNMWFIAVFAVLYIGVTIKDALEMFVELSYRTWEGEAFFGDEEEA